MTGPNVWLDCVATETHCSTMCSAARPACATGRPRAPGTAGRARRPCSGTWPSPTITSRSTVPRAPLTGGAGARRERGQARTVTGWRGGKRSSRGACTSPSWKTGSGPPPSTPRPSPPSARARCGPPSPAGPARAPTVVVLTRVPPAGRGQAARSGWRRRDPQG